MSKVRLSNRQRLLTTLAPFVVLGGVFARNRSCIKSNVQVRSSVALRGSRTIRNEDAGRQSVATVGIHGISKLSKNAVVDLDLPSLGANRSGCSDNSQSWDSVRGR